MSERIYGRRPVTEAERGRRRVHRTWRAPETSPEELERLCGSPDHQGVVAEGNKRELSGARTVLEELLPLLGLDSLIDEEEEAPAEARALMEERQAARAAKDYDRADSIRDQLAKLGWEVRDEAGGARLVRRR